MTYSPVMTRRLAEVAAKVGVSEATVSRVLNGRPGVSEATRTAVLTALDVLGYERPTKLRGDRARLVGLVLPELQNPIFPALAEVVGGALAQLGFTPVLCTLAAGGGLTEGEYVRMLLDQHVSGVVFSGGNGSGLDRPDGHYRLLQERALPVVFVNPAVPDLPFAQVSTDDSVAVQQAFGHLASLGHRRIGLIVGPEGHLPSMLKWAEFNALSQQSGLEVRPEQVERVNFTLEAGHAATTRLVHLGMTAIICGSDPLALGAIRAARRMGLRVPDELSVVGYDDSAFMMCTEPPLTTVRQPIEAMGRAAVAILVDAVSGGGSAPEQLLFEPELVVRGSTAPPAARPGVGTHEASAGS
jgi:DNA-binding LacI/PurR family transcriptional regulator